VAITGRFYDHAGRLAQAGEVFGFGGLAGSPVASSRQASSHPLFLCRRSISVLTPFFHVGRAGFLAEAIQAAGVSPSWEMLGLWLGAHARQSGRRLIYSPHLAAQRQDPTTWPQYRSDDEILAFLMVHRTLLEHEPYYSACLSLTPGEGYHPAPAIQRQVLLDATRSRLRYLAAGPFARRDRTKGTVQPVLSEVVV
jgi:hypothetical protein